MYCVTLTRLSRPRREAIIDDDRSGRMTVAEPNWSNQSIWTGDNLYIMRGMNSDSVDLIYLDPPFNSKANYAAPIGSQAAGAAFKDTWSLSDVDAEWINLMEAKHPALYRVLLAAMTASDKSYLAYQTGAYVLDVHQRPPSLGRMAQGAGDCDGGDGIDRRVLDPGVRDPSGSGSGSGVGQRDIGRESYRILGREQFERFAA